MYLGNDANGRETSSNLPSISTGRKQAPFKLDAESHQEFEGHIVHKLTAEQATRIPEHPAAKLFPKSESHIAKLQKSIAKSGQQVPCVLLDDQVLDGCCRIAANGRSGKDTYFVNYAESDLGGFTPLQWVLRRNRSAADGRRMTDAEFALIVAAAYGNSESELAKARQKTGVSQSGQFCGETSEVLGAAFGLSSNLLKQALRILKEKDATLESLVQQKKLSLSKAAEIARLPAPERPAAIADSQVPAPPANPQEALRALKRHLRSLEKLTESIERIASSGQTRADKQAPLTKSLLTLRESMAYLQWHLETDKAEVDSDASTDPQGKASRP